MRAPKKTGTVKKYKTTSVSTSYNPKADRIHDIHYKIEHSLTTNQQALFQRPTVVKSAILAIAKLVDLDIEEACKKWIGEPTNKFVEAYDNEVIN